jgi:hypothetical protein
MNEKNMKLLITNVVYGDLYTSIFLTEHLRSFLDETNIPAFKDRIEYIIYTDTESVDQIERHPFVKKLNEMIPVRTSVFTWPEKPLDRYSFRYSIQTTMIKESVREALEKGMLLSCLAADLVVAKDYLKNIFHAFDDSDCDSVLCVPMRTCLESMALTTKKYAFALPAEDLFKAAFNNLHPLWVASHWEAAQFSKIPYTMLWNTGAGLEARSFSVSPIAFKPTEEMKSITGVLDVAVPPLCKKPFLALDWKQCPMIGMEPLICYYPPFTNHVASEKWVASWAKKGTRADQLKNLRIPFYYPDKENAQVTEHYETVINQLAEGIINESELLDVAQK